MGRRAAPLHKVTRATCSQPSIEQEQQKQCSDRILCDYVRSSGFGGRHLYYTPVLGRALPAAWLQPRTSVQAKEFCPAPAPNEGRCGVCSVVCCGRELSGEIFGFSLPQIMDWLPRPRLYTVTRATPVSTLCPVMTSAAGGRRYDVASGHLLRCHHLTIHPRHTTCTLSSGQSEL